MTILRSALLLATTVAFAQEANYFAPPAPSWWEPAWELTLRGDQLTVPDYPADAFRRIGLQLRLKWTWEREAWRLEVGTRSALGSDGNQFNAPRWDQQPSNGSQMDTARAQVSWQGERSFGHLSLGFQENGLLVSQSLWDRDLRFLGGSIRMGVRSASGLLQEAGIRAEVGRVRNILGGEVDLAAGQGVLKLDTGPLSWSAHAGRWQLSWNPGGERLRRVPGQNPADRSRLVLDAAGGGAAWHARLPLEARWSGARNRENGDTSEEVQVLVGSQERVYWPQVSFTWQRLSSTGTLYPVNGDEWWLYRRARGPRFDIVLPLPDKWLASVSHLRQRSDGANEFLSRTMLVLVKRF
jgi:hypothetical protein